jgi:hypothetical protein
MTYTFEQVWKKIDGENRASMPEILEALQEEISKRESLASKLFHARKFETLTSVEQERNSFIQVQYGIQGLTYLGNGDESDIWKAAQAKKEEVKDREKAVSSEQEPRETSAGYWKKLIGERRSEIEDAIWKASSHAQEGLPGTYVAVVRLRGRSLTIYSVTRTEAERDVKDTKFEMSSSKAARIIDDWMKKFLETVEKDAESQKMAHPEGKNPADAIYQEAQKEKAEAQRVGEILSGAAAIPRGLDSNLPNADLSAEQEAVMSSIDKANTEIKDMRSAAPTKETTASQYRQNRSDATTLAKDKMGKGAIVTNAQAGRTYSGKIIGVAGVAKNHPDTIAIQRISGNQAVLHRIKDIASESNIAVGADLTLAKGKDGKTSVKTREEMTKEAQKNMGEELVR